jgi:hypothetical protein
VAVFLLLHPGFYWGNSRSHVGSGEGDALVSLSCWGLALDAPPVRGTSGMLWWFVSGPALCFSGPLGEVNKKAP